ncbi:cobyrinate a,c-diamide synthase [Agathobaculum sp.]|uniref:cobyrinate a,c-diamide synthase n=1 Tax=Agathobaculum sp. TaxID=2048138 RepID=UPI002A7ECA13|nr:cobyrinate a,c-diamide synthase [Agathobaculum sp.]MDY3619032.1 cobyrinate a,c-diamide synthase [Agathobaculum sp.]
MTCKLPRLMIAGTHSGCGKTTVTSAVLQELVERGTVPAAFKCGPDFIDPMFHTEVIGAPSRNLDLFLCDGDTVRYLLAKHAENAPLAVMEGVMGYYDGVAGTTARASSCDLAVETGTPTVLVLQVKGMSLSAAAALRGFLDFAPNTMQGVILNGVSGGMYGFYREIIEQNTGLRVYGYLPQDDAAAISSRHLGLITAAEVRDLRGRLRRLAELAAQCIDLEGLQSLAQSAPPLCWKPAKRTQASGEPARIGVARDRAFCFYYEDNFDLLRSLGAELVPFSPLKDTTLPDGLDGLYLGGGYPELYAGELEANRTMRESIRAAVQGGMPTLAECGGFLYLHERLEGHEMAGALPLSAKMEKKLHHFGYVTLTAARDSLLCPKGESIRAHEFHYAASSDAGCACMAQKPLQNRAWPCVHASDALFAGFPHLHFYADPAVAARFVSRCAHYRKENAK